METTPTSEPSVLLVSMPWTTVAEPSLGLAILKAKLLEEGIQCKVLHLNLLLLKYLSIDTYATLADTFGLNDFLFTSCIDPSTSLRQLNALHAIVDDMADGGTIPPDERAHFVAKCLRIRNKVIPQYLLDCADEICRHKATLIGFTCLFDQTIASVALAKLLRGRIPNALIAFGGYALEGETGEEVLRSFPWIDCVARGEGEEVIGPLANASLNRDMLTSIRGIMTREADGSASALSGFASPKPDLNTSPFPNYDDYLDDLQVLKQQHRVTIRVSTLPVETSRGCWWGESHHCVFCGIDKDTLTYRSKSPDVVLSMLDTLKTRYGANKFRISDYILPSTYFSTLLPCLANLRDKYVLTCEIKSNMTSDRFRLMADAGFIEVQPGIESFSTSVLKKMDKGVSAIQNIYTLLLGKRNNIRIHYNFLYGFPDDTLVDYEQLVRTTPLLYHLDPPNDITPVQVTRFAPLQTDPMRFGLAGQSTFHKKYEVLFSDELLASTGFDLNKYCYYFQRNFSNSAELEELYAVLRVQVAYWKRAQMERPVTLSYDVSESGIVFNDTRCEGPSKVVNFGPEHAQLYLFIADTIRSLAAVEEMAHIKLGIRDAAAILEEMMENGLVFVEGNRIIGLGLPLMTHDRVHHHARVRGVFPCPDSVIA